ncbi:hypothetical protein BDZ89DRAFT_576328 [Hymenopellis radicata]|nr:hypothetical protein BDZ89DRAFT_576328 [Hymenopellis radicata]
MRSNNIYSDNEHRQRHSMKKNANLHYTNFRLTLAAFPSLIWRRPRKRPYLLSPISACFTVGAFSSSFSTTTVIGTLFGSSPLDWYTPSQTRPPTSPCRTPAPLVRSFVTAYLLTHRLAGHAGICLGRPPRSNRLVHKYTR